MSEANDGDEEEYYEETSDVQYGTQDVSHMTRTLSLDDVASTRVSDVKVQGLGCNSGLQACSLSEVGCIHFEVKPVPFGFLCSLAMF